MFSSQKHKNPCYNCSKRYVGCHSTCEDHIIWKNNDKELKTKKYAENDAVRLKLCKISKRKGW